MTVFYNRIAGRNLHRIAALCDGVFAVAMTLLVLDLRAPAANAIHSERDLLHALAALSPRLLTYLMSFVTLGIFWVGQQTQHDHMAKSDRSYAWINIAFLMVVSLVPFSTAFLAEFITYKTALLVYWLNILMLGVLIGGQLYRARAFGLLKEDVPQEYFTAVVRRVVTAQALYAFGAALCLISNWWAIGFIVALQLIYAIAPRFKPFSWL
jgi:uncharacterized membrane protein